MILESFWDELNIDNIEDLHYLSNTPYNTLDQKNNVLDKLGWILTRLNSGSGLSKRDYDIKIITELKHCIHNTNKSLTLRGVDYLNHVAESLTNSEF